MAREGKYNQWLMEIDPATGAIKRNQSVTALSETEGEPAWSPNLNLSLRTRLDLGNSKVEFGGTTTLNAILRAWIGGTPLSDREVEFHFLSDLIGKAKTNAQGKASLSYKIPEVYHPGFYQTTAFYRGDGGSLSNPAVLTVMKARTKMSANPPLVDANRGSNAVLSITLKRRDNSVGIASKKVVFSWNGQKLGEAITNSNGIASLQVSAGDQRRTYKIEVTFPSDEDYQASKGVLSLRVR